MAKGRQSKRVSIASDAETGPERSAPRSQRQTRASVAADNTVSDQLLRCAYANQDPSVFIFTWLSAFHAADDHTSSLLCADLFAFLLKAAGVEEIDSLESLAIHLGDVSGVAVTSYLTNVAAGDAVPSFGKYPLAVQSSKTAQFRAGGFARVVSAVIAALNADDVFASPSPITALRLVSISMATTPVRAFRHTGTVAAMAYLCGVAKLLTRLMESHESPGVVEDLKKEVELVFDQVVKHRIRDSLPAIRVAVCEMLGSAAVELPSVIHDNSQLKFLGWALSDRDPYVRLASVQAIGSIARSPTNDSIRELVTRFSKRLVEMTADEDDDVAEATIYTLEACLSRNMVTREDVLPSLPLVSAAMPSSFRRAMGGLLHTYIFGAEGVVAVAAHEARANGRSEIDISGIRIGELVAVLRQLSLTEVPRVDATVAALWVAGSAHFSQWSAYSEALSISVDLSEFDAYRTAVTSVLRVAVTCAVTEIALQQSMPNATEKERQDALLSLPWIQDMDRVDMVVPQLHFSELEQQVYAPLNDVSLELLEPTITALQTLPAEAVAYLLSAWVQLPPPVQGQLAPLGTEFLRHVSELAIPKSLESITGLSSIILSGRPSPVAAAMDVLGSWDIPVAESHVFEINSALPQLLLSDDTDTVILGAHCTMAASRCLALPSVSDVLIAIYQAIERQLSGDLTSSQPMCDLINSIPPLAFDLKWDENVALIDQGRLALQNILTNGSLMTEIRARAAVALSVLLSFTQTTDFPAPFEFDGQELSAIDTSLEHIAEHIEERLDSLQNERNALYDRTIALRSSFFTAYARLAAIQEFSPRCAPNLTARLNWHGFSPDVQGIIKAFIQHMREDDHWHQFEFRALVHMFRAARQIHQKEYDEWRTGKAQETEWADPLLALARGLAQFYGIYGGRKNHLSASREAFCKMIGESVVSAVDQGQDYAETLALVLPVYLARMSGFEASVVHASLQQHYEGQALQDFSRQLLSLCEDQLLQISTGQKPTRISLPAGELPVAPPIDELSTPSTAPLQFSSLQDSVEPGQSRLPNEDEYGSEQLDLDAPQTFYSMAARPAGKRSPVTYIPAIERTLKLLGIIMLVLTVLSPMILAFLTPSPSPCENDACISMERKWLAIGILIPVCILSLCVLACAIVIVTTKGYRLLSMHTSKILGILSIISTCFLVSFLSVTVTRPQVFLSAADVVPVSGVIVESGIEFEYAGLSEKLPDIAPEFTCIVLNGTRRDVKVPQQSDIVSAVSLTVAADRTVTTHTSKGEDDKVSFELGTLPSECLLILRANGSAKQMDEVTLNSGRVLRNVFVDPGWVFELKSGTISPIHYEKS